MSTRTNGGHALFDTASATQIPNSIPRHGTVSDRTRRIAGNLWAIPTPYSTTLASLVGDILFAKLIERFLSKASDLFTTGDPEIADLGQTMQKLDSIWMAVDLSSAEAVLAAAYACDYQWASFLGLNKLKHHYEMRELLVRFADDLEYELSKRGLLPIKRRYSHVASRDFHWDAVTRGPIDVQEITGSIQPDDEGRVEVRFLNKDTGERLGVSVYGTFVADYRLTTQRLIADAEEPEPWRAEDGGADWYSFGVMHYGK